MNSGIAYPKVFSGLNEIELVSSMERPEHLHTLPCQLGLLIVFASKVCVGSLSMLVITSTFRLPVIGVILICSGKQVAWITAWWIIAVMENVKSFWNLFTTKGIGYSMRYLVLPINAKSTVRAGESGPWPAFVIGTLSDHCPESLRHLGTLVQLLVSAVTEAIRKPAKVVRDAIQRLFTVTAGRVRLFHDRCVSLSDAFGLGFRNVQGALEARRHYSI